MNSIDECILRLKKINFSNNKDRFIDSIDDFTDDEKEKYKSFFKNHREQESKIDWNDTDGLCLAIRDTYNDYMDEHDMHAKFDKNDFEYIDENDNYIFYQIISHNGALETNSYRMGGQGAKWCIGESGDERSWNSYSNRGFKFILVYNKSEHVDDNERKWIIQVDNDSITCWDQLDNIISEDEDWIINRFGIDFDLHYHNYQDNKVEIVSLDNIEVGNNIKFGVDKGTLNDSYYNKIILQILGEVPNNIDIELYDDHLSIGNHRIDYDKYNDILWDNVKYKLCDELINVSNALIADNYINYASNVNTVNSILSSMDTTIWKYEYGIINNNIVLNIRNDIDNRYYAINDFSSIDIDLSKSKHLDLDYENDIATLQWGMSVESYDVSLSDNNVYKLNKLVEILDKYNDNISTIFEKLTIDTNANITYDRQSINSIDEFDNILNLKINMGNKVDEIKDEIAQYNGKLYLNDDGISIKGNHIDINVESINSIDRGLIDENASMNHLLRGQFRVTTEVDSSGYKSYELYSYKYRKKISTTFDIDNIKKIIRYYMPHSTINFSELNDILARKSLTKLVNV